MISPIAKLSELHQILKTANQKELQDRFVRSLQQTLRCL